MLSRRVQMQVLAHLLKVRRGAINPVRAPHGLHNKSSPLGTCRCCMSNASGKPAASSVAEGGNSGRSSFLPVESQRGAPRSGFGSKNDRMPAAAGLGVVGAATLTAVVAASGNDASAEKVSTFDDAKLLTKSVASVREPACAPPSGMGVPQASFLS
ncbi:unnamed protein product [Discosporangium mesarthrocarpum]